VLLVLSAVMIQGFCVEENIDYNITLANDAHYVKRIGRSYLASDVRRTSTVSGEPCPYYMNRIYAINQITFHYVVIN